MALNFRVAMMPPAGFGRERGRASPPLIFQKSPRLTPFDDALLLAVYAKPRQLQTGSPASRLIGTPRKRSISARDKRGVSWTNK